MSLPLIITLAESIEARPRSYVLRRPVFVAAQQLAADESDAAAWWAENEGLAISGYGPTLPDALREVSAAFDLQYRGLVQVPAEHLSAGALVVRQRLRQCVAAVRERS